MKSLLTLIAAYAMCSRIAYAQPDESKEFLYLYSDSVIYAERIDLERNFTGSLHLWVDSKRIHPEQVKFFNNNRGFFANVRDLGLSGETSFSERIRKGRINLYEAKTVDWDAYDDMGGYPLRPKVIESRNFYNIGFGSLKKANYVNLSIDLVDNPQSMVFLNKYRSIKRTQMAMYVAAGLSFIAGVVVMQSGEKNFSLKSDGRPGFSSNKSTSSGLVSGLALSGVGIGLATGGYLIGPSRTKYLKRAIDAYND